MAALLSCISCQDGYPIPASQCDQWCDAAQQIQCNTEDPSMCVRRCNLRGGDATECHDQLDVTVACLRDMSSKGMRCPAGYDPELTRLCDAQETGYEACATQYADPGFASTSWYGF